MILPLTHERMTVQRLPWITIGIIAINVVVFIPTWQIAVTDQEELYEVLNAASTVSVYARGKR